MVDLKELIKRGVHFGHQTSRWSPKMAPYIWGSKNDIHLIRVDKTAAMLEKAAQFLESIASEGRSILWVGTKKAAQETIKRVGAELHQPNVVNRWVGGTFSNYRQIRKAVANLLHGEDVLAKSDQFNYTKKELNTIQKRIARLDKNVGGIRKLTWPVGAVVVVDVKKEHVAIKEAIATGIPIVALVDTNCDPSHIDYVIPANDDAPRAVEFLIDYLAQAVKRGLETAAAKPKDETGGISDVFESVFDEAALTEEEEKETQRKRAKGAPVASRQAKRAPVRKRVATQEEEVSPKLGAAESE